jgi:CubicO group peptidase (beta-lactamase class C family)
LAETKHEIRGVWDARFRRVRDVFEEGFRERGEIGASVAVAWHGELVVDLWAGHADPVCTRPWERDTIVNLYSTSKGLTALCALRLVERGDLDLDAPVAAYWPEFAAAGKQDVRVRWLLSHRAGLPAVRRPLPPELLYDWKGMCDALAAEAPWWPPGSEFGYHPVTYGWLVGEVVRRISGRSLGAFFREQFAAPAGLDLHFGLPEAALSRCADMSDLTPPPELVAAMSSGDGRASPVFLAFANPMGNGDHNSEAYRRAEIPAINGHGNARSLALVYGALANGGAMRGGSRLLDTATIELAREEQSRGTDRLLSLPIRLGLGFWLGQPDQPGFGLGPGAGSFGHPGAGGSLGFADPETGIGFGYAMNRMGAHLAIDPRAQALIDAVYAALGPV